jgi:O-antigen/teichoic acid export membrane protein
MSTILILFVNWDNLKNFRDAKNISFIGISNIGGNAVSALFWIFLAGILESENYGEISFLLGIGSIAIAASLLGSEQAITVYSAKNIKIQPPIYLISLISSSVSAVILFVAFQNIGLSIFVLGHVIYSLTLAEALGRKLYKNYSIYYLLQKIIFVILALFFFSIMGPEGVLLGYGLSMMFLAKKIYDSLKNSKIDFKILKSKSRFIIHNYILDISRVSKGQIDKILIGTLFGFTLLGNYFLSLQIISVLGILPGIITKYTLPEDSSGKSTKKIKLITAGFSVILTLIGIFIAPILLPLFFPHYTDSLELLPLLSISIIPSTISSLYISKFLGMEKSNFIIFAYLISFSTSILGLVYLGPLWGIVGIATTLVISSSLQATFFVILDFKISKHSN